MTACVASYCGDASKLWYSLVKLIIEITFLKFHVFENKSKILKLVLIFLHSLKSFKILKRVSETTCSKKGPSHSLV